MRASKTAGFMISALAFLPVVGLPGCKPPCPTNTPGAQQSPAGQPSAGAQPSGNIAQPSTGVQPSVSQTSPAGNRCAAAGGNIITVNPGSRIQQAVNSAQAGSTICVMPGTYNETFEITNSGNASAHLKIVCDTKWACNIHPAGIGPNSTSGTNWHTWSILFLSGSYIDIDGFDIAPEPGGFRQTGVSLGGNYVSIKNSRIHDIGTGIPGSTGSCVGSEGTEVVFENNLIYHCGTTTLDHGIYIAAGSATVDGNIVGNVSGFALHTWHSVNTVKFINNTLFNTGQDAITLGNGESSVTLTGAIIANNIIYNENAREFGQVSGAKWINNLIFGGTINLINGVQCGTITGDPLFVNYNPDGTGDYRLQPGSPAIGKADATYAPTTNVDGTIRVAPPNKGAY